MLKQLSACKIDSYMPYEAVDVDYMMENIGIVEYPQECADRIRKLYEQVGEFGSLPAITQDQEDPQWEHECLELLMNDVDLLVADLE